MAIYKETYRLSNDFPGFIALKNKFDLYTGLNNEMEILTDKSVVFFNEKLKTTIEASIESGNFISLFFSPRRKKNYIEWSLIYALNEHLSTPNEHIPDYAKKKWKDLSFIEKHFS